MSNRVLFGNLPGQSGPGYGTKDWLPKYRQEKTLIKMSNNKNIDKLKILYLGILPRFSVPTIY